MGLNTQPLANSKPAKMVWVLERGLYHRKMEKLGRKCLKNEDLSDRHGKIHDISQFVVILTDFFLKKNPIVIRGQNYKKTSISKISITFDSIIIPIDFLENTV